MQCVVCGKEMGWEPISGVCSEQCLRAGQGFNALPTPASEAAEIWACLKDCHSVLIQFTEYQGSALCKRIKALMARL